LLYNWFKQQFFLANPTGETKIRISSYTLFTQLRDMSEGVRFPIRVGRGQSRVTIYNRTDALPYYRICYRLGAIRKQRTCNSVDSAICCAETISRKLGSRDAAVIRV